MSGYTAPESPREEIGGLVYFCRMCDKIRLHTEGKLDPEYHPNLGKAMDSWVCQLLQIDYSEFVEQVKSGADDCVLLEWCFRHGYKPREEEISWWNCYMRNCGRPGEFLDERLVFRKKEAGWQDRDEIVTFFDFIDADEGRL